MLSLLTFSLCFIYQSNNQAANSPVHPSIHPVAPLPTRDQSINQRPTNPSTHPSTKPVNQSITWKLSRGTVRRLTNKLPVLADRLFRRMIPTVYQYQKHTRTQLLQSFSNSSPSDSGHKSSATQLQQLFSYSPCIADHNVILLVIAQHAKDPVTNHTFPQRTKTNRLLVQPTKTTRKE